MLLYELGRRDEAFRSFDRAGRDSRCSSLASVLKGIYGRRSSVRGDIAGYRKVIGSQLSGWFRKRALFHLYEAAGQGKLAGEIMRQEEEDGSRLMAGFSLVGLIILLLELSGLVFWLNFLLNPPGKREGSGPLNPALSLADAWLVFVSWEVLQILLGRFFLPAFIRSSSVPMLFGAYLLNYGAALILLRAFSGGKISSFSASLGLRSLNIKSEALAGLGAYVGALPLVTAAALLSRLFFKGADFSSNPVVPLIGGSGNALDRFLLFLLVACLAPVFEEILFRGLIYGVLRKKAGPVLSSLLVSLLFSFLHVDPVGLLPIFVLGILLAWLYEHTGSLIPSMVLHALWNCQVFFMAGFFLGS
jgi:membrane protease YdiL (CAAX protease family)